MEEKRKRAPFAELNEEQKRRISKICYNATLASNFRGSVIKKNYTFASSQYILDKAKYYVDNFASASEKIAYIKAKKEYEDLAKSNGIYYRDDTISQNHIIAISKIEDMDELDRYIKGENPSGKEIQISNLRPVIEGRGVALYDKDGLYSSVKSKLLAYEKYKYEKRVKKNLDKSKLTLEENKTLSKITLQDFLDSEFIYKKDYCLDRKLSMNVFDKRAANIKEFDPEFFNKYQKSLETKRLNYYRSLEPVVIDILDNLTNNKDYSIIDYYLAHKDLYTFEDLCRCCSLYNMDIRKLKTFFSGVNVKSSLSYDSFINQSYKINNHEYTQEEKERIYNYAKENFIPFNWDNVPLLIKKQFSDNQKKHAA